ncbi:hypothetical protein ACIQB5_42175 [Streptomyces sp. NPDC088560]|uniref:hypothetical protein n=1 Tax=Streptomyces sp. NPDC088560 TaxID=3365868 RepID=UPI00382CAAD5
MLKMLPAAQPEAAMTTNVYQEQHSKGTRIRSTPPVVARTAPISAAARAFAVRHGDPAGWPSETHRVYAELGGWQ